MTPEERAEKVVVEWNDSSSTNKINMLIADAIRAAVEEDRSMRTADDLYKHSYSRGRAEAYENAAKIILESCQSKECENKCWHVHTIRAMAKGE